MQQPTILTLRRNLDSCSYSKLPALICSVSACTSGMLWSRGTELSCCFMNKPSEEMFLCTNCITAPRFVQWITENGQPGQCDFNVNHRGRGRVVTVEVFAVYVDEFFREHYQIGGEEP